MFSTKSESFVLIASGVRRWHTTTLRPLAAGRLRARGGWHHRFLTSFFPCNAHRVNAKISHSRGGGGCVCVCVCVCHGAPPRLAAYTYIHRYIHIYYAPISGKENDKVAKQNASCGDHTIDAHASECAITTGLATAHVNHRMPEVLTVSARPDCFRVAKSGYCQPARRELAVGLQRKAVQPQPPKPQLAPHRTCLTAVPAESRQAKPGKLRQS